MAANTPVLECIFTRDSQYRYYYVFSSPQLTGAPLPPVSAPFEVRRCAQASSLLFHFNTLMLPFVLSLRPFRPPSS